VRNIAGWLTGAKFVEGKAADTGRVTAQLHLSAAVSGIRTLVADAWKRGKRDLVGLSIDADGKATTAMREGKKVREAQRITRVSSVDLIVEPGAGGQLIRMVESFNQEEQDMKLRKDMLAAIQQKAPKVFASINAETITDDDLLVKYTEALATPDTSASAAAAATAATASQPAAAAPAGVTREQLGQAVKMVEARAYARGTIMSSTLPQAAKEKLAAEFAARERFAEADVDARIKGEREYLARFTESGRVSIDLGEGDVSVESRRKKIDTMLDDFFKQSADKPLMSFKECYIEITGDTRVTGRLENCDRARLREALGEADFRESLDSTSFANVLGNSITRRMIADYRTPILQRLAAARDARADLRLPHAGAHALRRLRRSADRARGDPVRRARLADRREGHLLGGQARRHRGRDARDDQERRRGLDRAHPGEAGRAAKRTLASSCSTSSARTRTSTTGRRGSAPATTTSSPRRSPRPSSRASPGDAEADRRRTAPIAWASRPSS
jgi:hypothetical protein